MVQQIETVSVLLEKDQHLEVEKFAPNGAIDFAMKNIGETDIMLWGSCPLLVDDGLLSFPGYENKIRKDSISIKFDGGEGKLLVLITKYVTPCK